MNFCPNCGHQMTGAFCSNCGYSQTNMKQTKNGKATASLVLGIIAVIWAMFELLAFSEIEPSLNELILESGLSKNATIISFLIGFNFISLPCGIIGLILGLKSKENGMGKTGIIMSVIALGVCVISAIYTFTTI